MYIGLLANGKEPDDPAYKRIRVMESGTISIFPMGTIPWVEHSTHIADYAVAEGGVPTNVRDIQIGSLVIGMRPCLSAEGERQEQAAFEAWLAAQPKMSDEWWLGHIRAAFGKRISVYRQSGDTASAWGAYWQHYTGFGDTPLEALTLHTAEAVGFLLPPRPKPGLPALPASQVLQAVHKRFRCPCAPRPAS